MKHQAFAPEFRFTSPEPFALAQERAVDHDAIQRLAAQKLRHQAESDLKQLRLESGTQEPGN
jgi:hypothetical protein